MPEPPCSPCWFLFCTKALKRMDPESEEDKTKPKGTTCPKLNVFLSWLIVMSFVVPTNGFFLKSCHMSADTATCVQEGLSAVPRDIPPTVTNFDLTANNISRIQAGDFTNLPVLTRLDLNRNKILQIDSGAFAGLTYLEKLNLNNNRLVTLGEKVFDGLIHLTELRLNSNRIKEVASTSFQSMRSLRFLDLSYNKLQSLAKLHLILQHLPHLRELIFRKNDLETFQSWKLTNSSLELRSLDVSQNPLSNFSITADVFPNLTWFNIGGASKKQRMAWDVRNKTFMSRVSTVDLTGLQVTLEDMRRILETVNSSLTSLKMNAMRLDLSALINLSCKIPTLSKLQLRTNNIKFVSSDMFKLCVNVTELDLTKNKIKKIDDNAFRSLPNLKILRLGYNKLSSVPNATRNLPALEELEFNSNNIVTFECHDFANQTMLRKLTLHNNSIPALKECLFKDLIRLQSLRLQNNRLTELKGAFSKHLPNLLRLYLNGNKLTSINKWEFKGLRSLQNLSLHENPISKLHNESFVGLTNLTDIQLQSNALKSDAINTGAFNVLMNLRRLDLRDNHIKYEDSSPLPDPPFSKLSRLVEFNFPGQHRKGKSSLPLNFLQGLTNLLIFSARNLQLISLHGDMFNSTPRLQQLDISSNDLTDLSTDLFAPIKDLRSLYISRTSLNSLDFLVGAQLTRLEFLQARKNLYSVISEEVIKSMPALQYLDLQGNSFTCDCDNSWFLNWTRNDPQTQVYDAFNFSCNYPPDFKGEKLLQFDSRDCTVDAGFVCFVSTTCIILGFMVAAFTQQFMRWQLVYAYYLFLAWLYDAKHKNRDAPNEYDAFISYNANDEPWVFGELVPKLEGEQGWRLCLHHRDFEPGKPIIDNITDSIYGSRKTICVISHRYLESEWCSREIQAASFRLFDEQQDVLILVFLEEIPSCRLSPFHRMRKMLKRKTYLSWPRAGEHPEVFWEKLRQALRTGGDLDDRFLLTVEDAP